MSSTSLSVWLCNFDSSVHNVKQTTDCLLSKVWITVIFIIVTTTIIIIIIIIIIQVKAGMVHVCVAELCDPLITHGPYLSAFKVTYDKVLNKFTFTLLCIRCVYVCLCVYSRL